ncbi:hypothetical protein [Undibacterium flavidum]|uniref:Type II secretion system (T2SS) protein M subtype b n=1 Tax=Undibacterium flavidum TaxID=2762297 RepID=A0ABR6YBB1_9BURK|nr:hypothetical protein [Undibacterium flavidum]MBC3873840.1 hypothetical protein [Undibacterium flavidum]
MLFPPSLRVFRWSTSQHWPWLAALTLLCFSLSLYWVELPALRSQEAQLVQQIRTLEVELRRPIAPVAREHNVDVQQRLASFERLAVVIKDLHTQASLNGLIVSEASHQPSDDAVGEASEGRHEIARIDIRAKMTGTYVGLKASLASLLSAHDGLALESLSLRRQRSTDAVMEIDVGLRFFYRKQP